MSIPALGVSSNGHLSPERDVDSEPMPEPPQHDSDNLDTPNDIADPASPSGSEVQPGRPVVQLDNDEHMSDSAGTSPGDASGDADFDMQESPPSQNEDEAPVDRPSSSDSSRAPKRKAVVDEHEFMKANPELYGLRRSVCSRVNHWKARKLTYLTRLDRENSAKWSVTV